MGPTTPEECVKPDAPARRELPTSRSLLARLRVRDEAAWRDCLALYTPLVVCWCARKGLAEEDIADVAQEVFRKLASHIDAFRKEGQADSFRGWLCRITHRQLADFFRRSDGGTQPRGGTEAMIDMNRLIDTRAGEAEEQQAAGYLYRKAVELARAEFTEEAWRIFWRAAVDGNPAPEVAAEFGTTPAAVRQVKSRVLRRLKQLVGDMPE